MADDQKPIRDDALLLLEVGEQLHELTEVLFSEEFTHAVLHGDFADVKTMDKLALRFSAAFMLMWTQVVGPRVAAGRTGGEEQAAKTREVPEGGEARAEE